jgi:hypothetical protein
MLTGFPKYVRIQWQSTVGTVLWDYGQCYQSVTAFNLIQTKKAQRTFFVNNVCTVKPEYNGHPWDPKKVAVVQKMVVGQRLVQHFVVVLAELGTQACRC